MSEKIVTQEEWTRWEPIEGLAERYYIKSLLEDDDGLKIILADARGDSKKIQIFFDGLVSGYRHTDETLRYDNLCNLKEKYGTDLYVHWSFFKITNSTYLEWLSRESCTISDNLSLMHFVIYTSDVLLDIAASYEPKVEFID